MATALSISLGLCLMMASNFFNFAVAYFINYRNVEQPGELCIQRGIPNYGLFKMFRRKTGKNISSNSAVKVSSNVTQLGCNCTQLTWLYRQRPHVVTRQLCSVQWCSCLGDVVRIVIRHRQCYKKMLPQLSTAIYTMSYRILSSLIVSSKIVCA